MVLFFRQIKSADVVIIGHMGSSSSKNVLFRPEGYSYKPNANKEACGKKRCYFWFHSVVNFRRVLRSFWFSHFWLILMEFLKIFSDKVLYLRLLRVISCLQVRKCLYKRFICLKNLTILFYVFIQVREGEGALMQVLYGNTQWAFPTETFDWWMEYSWPAHVFRIFSKIHKRMDQRRGK